MTFFCGGLAVEMAWRIGFKGVKVFFQKEAYIDSGLGLVIR